MWYNAQGDQAPESIQIVSGTVSWWQSDPASIASWREQHGYIYPERPPQPMPEPEPIDTTDFDAACAQFRDICYTIGNAIGDPDFRGGFEEMVKLQQAPIYNTIEGLQLANAWSALNDLCTYEGKKIGLGQPEWWHTCWEQVAPTEEPSEPEEQPVEPELDINAEELTETTQVEEPDYSDVDAPDGTIEEPVIEEVVSEPAIIDEPDTPELPPEESIEEPVTPQAEE